MIDLSDFSKDNSVVYALVRIDAAGRVRDRRLVIEVLGWHPSDTFSIGIVDSIVVVTRAVGGLHIMTRAGQINLPRDIRTQSGALPRQSLLLAAIRERGLLFAYSEREINRMLVMRHRLASEGDAR